MWLCVGVSVEDAVRLRQRESGCDGVRERESNRSGKENMLFL